MTHAAPQAPMVGDHLALDLLNTVAQADGATIDYWRNGADVLAWLDRQGLTPGEGMKPDRTALLTQAKALRTAARTLVLQYKEGHVEDIAPLETYLHAWLSTPHLARDADGRLALVRVARADAVASLLGPVAEAVAQLLVDSDVNLVKQCEHPDCVLWFYDRTKAHKRRWCSMALCGNRYKAAQFRKKSATAG